MKTLNTEEFVSVGYIHKGHGYKGHAKLAIADEWIPDFMEQDFLFLEIDGYKVPYPIQSKDEQNDIIVKLEFIESVEELQAYFKKEVFLLKKDIKHAHETIAEQEEQTKLVGIHIKDKTLGDLGPITRIDQYPQQEMAILLNEQNEEVLIPLHPSLVIEVNEADRYILMDLPEGLL